jgi:hypothetical protein
MPSNNNADQVNENENKNKGTPGINKARKAAIDNRANQKNLGNKRNKSVTK